MAPTVTLVVARRALAKQVSSMAGPGRALPPKQHADYLRRNPQCVVCGRTEDLAIDHIVPRARGGGDEEENLQTLCRFCNTQKGTKSDSEWRMYWADVPRPPIHEIIESLRN